MPFSKNDTWRIISALRLPQSQEKEIATRLQSTEQRSELLVTQVLNILSQIEAAKREKYIAATEEAGVVEIGGGHAGSIKYSKKRVCVVKGELEELRQDLANLIGYELEVMSFPF